MSIKSIPAFKCNKCGFINVMFIHCPRCGSHLLFSIFALEPEGYNEIHLTNIELLKDKLIVK